MGSNRVASGSVGLASPLGQIGIVAEAAVSSLEGAALPLAGKLLGTGERLSLRCRLGDIRHRRAVERLDADLVESIVIAESLPLRVVD